MLISFRFENESRLIACFSELQLEHSERKRGQDVGMTMAYATMCNDHCNFPSWMRDCLLAIRT